MSAGLPGRISSAPSSIQTNLTSLSRCATHTYFLFLRAITGLAPPLLLPIGETGAKGACYAITITHSPDNDYRRVARIAGEPCPGAHEPRADPPVARRRVGCRRRRRTRARRGRCA